MGSVCELRRLALPPSPRSGPYSSSDSLQRWRDAGSCDGAAACVTALLLQRNGHGPRAGSKAPTTCSWTPRRRRPRSARRAQVSQAGRSPCEAAFRSRWPRSRPSAPGPRPPCAAQLAPAPAGAPRMSRWGTPNPRADPRSLRGRTARPRGSEPTAAVFCAPTADSAAQPVALEDWSESAPLAARRGQLRGEGASVCARRRPGKAGREGGDRRGGRRGRGG